MRRRGSGIRVKIIEPLSLEKWNKILLVLNVVGVSIDPLFFYIPVVNKSCRGFDTKLMYATIALRALTDIGDVINIIVQFCNLSAKEYLYHRFLIDILAILPLPQVVILIVIPHQRYSRIVNMLIVFVFLQYVPRIQRIHPLYTKVKKTSGILTETAWAKAMFNFFFFMLASHVLGASWYFFSIQREISCWVKVACRRHAGCVPGSFYCHDSLENNDYLGEFCPIETPDTSLFDFGIFLDALQSGIVESTNFLQKFFYCFLWGLRNLSSFGQNLRTSKFIWENGFAVLITISGMVLFITFIGNMQMYLQANTLRLEAIRLKNKEEDEMRLKTQDIEQWASFALLSDGLQKRVKRYQQYKWLKTTGSDVENLLRDLPKDLRMNIERELRLYSLRRVPLFNAMDEQILDAMCDRLKPVLFTEGHYIVKEGDPVKEMFFFTRGKLSNGVRTGLFNRECLKAGDFCGEELLTWALDLRSSSNPPTSTRTVCAIGEVGAFALTADDLKENRLLDALARGNECSQSLGTTLHASRFAAKTILARRRRRGSGRSPEILKPTDPDFTCKE